MSGDGVEGADFAGAGLAGAGGSGVLGSLTCTLIGPERRVGGTGEAGGAGAAAGFSSSMSPKRSSDVRSLSSSFGSLRPELM